MKIAIVGFGVEGKVSYEYFARQGEVTIVDERENIADLPIGASVLLGKGVFDRLQGFDLVVHGPGIAPRKITTDGKVWSATNEFFAKCPAQIIGVTGSKGKGTTTSLIASILQESGRTVHLVGNIGEPALAILNEITPSDLVVYEMSSFQLWDIERSPHIAVVLMIESDHLDVHADFDEYVMAKANITRFQVAEDLLVYNVNNSFSSSIAEKSKAKKCPYPSQDTAHVQDEAFWYGKKRICSIEALQLPGAFNQENACAAINTAWSFTNDVVAIERGLRSFKGLPHRLKFVREVAGVRYFDDSIATTPGSAIAAMKAFSSPKVLILGGSSKGAKFDEVATAASENNVKAAILIGEEAQKIESALKDKNVKTINLGQTVTMSEIVITSRQFTESGDVVILSPACASFGMFKNYKDRGDQFIQAVNSL